MGPVSRETVQCGRPAVDDTWPLREEGPRGYRCILNSSSSRARAMANPTCRNCDRRADAGPYCSSCAAGIMANALNPFYGWPAEETSITTRETSSAAGIAVRQALLATAPLRVLTSSVSRGTA